MDVGYTASSKNFRGQGRSRGRGVHQYRGRERGHCYQHFNFTNRGAYRGQARGRPAFQNYYFPSGYPPDCYYVKTKNTPAFSSAKPTRAKCTTTPRGYYFCGELTHLIRDC